MRSLKYAQLSFTMDVQNSDRLDELKKVSELLDANPEVNELVLADLSREVELVKGRKGLSAEQVVRALYIKQREQYTYEQLKFHLNDSSSYRWFCRLEWNDTVSSSSLQRDIAKIRPETLEQINRILVTYAKRQGIEKARKVRTDCTGVETSIHKPTDSMLLWDCVRVLTRGMKEAKSKVSKVTYVDHTRRAKRRAFAIENAKSKEKRLPLYEDLLTTTKETYRDAQQTVTTLQSLATPAALALVSTLSHFLSLTSKVIEQTERRVIRQESVPAQDKIVSIFEPHTDLIAKGNRALLYGHKICLTGGASGMILDCLILDGNPADSTLTTGMVKRLVDIFGQAPRQVTFDGAFHSIANLNDIKNLGVEDVVFSKSRGTDVEDMAKSQWVYKQLRRFRAGIEATISFLKRCFGLSRCTWRGRSSFKSYVWSSIVAANLLTAARYAAA